MASNLSTIGFHFANEEQFRDAMMACAADAGDVLDCPSGHYGIWTSPSGAQVWFHLKRTPAGEVEIFGLTPFFDGKSDVTLTIRRAIQRPGDNPFEGSLESVIETQPGDAYPISFDAVDFALSGVEELPAKRRVRLSAFARDIAGYKDEASYYAAAEQGPPPVFAAQCFVPLGMFASEQNEEDGASAAPVQPALAYFTGRIVEHSRLVNEKTGHAFEWLMVETLGATLDVLADPQVIDGELCEGGTVAVNALLFGRILG